MSLWRPDLWIDEIWTIFNSEGKITVATDCLRVLPQVLQINMNFVFIVVMMYQQCGYIHLKPKTVTSWFNHGVKIKDRNNRTIVPQNMKTIKMKEKGVCLRFILRITRFPSLVSELVSVTRQSREIITELLLE